MTRRLLLTVFCAGLSVLAHTDGSRAVPQSDEVAQFQRNQVLIEALVDSTLRLADEEDPLARAEACAEVADRFAAELQGSARQRDAVRAAEIGRHLHDLLAQGVAANLQAARRLIPSGSTGEDKLRDVSRKALLLMQTLDASLRSAADAEEPGEVRAVLDELVRKHAVLEKSLTPTTPAAEN
jgi:hypothetical protein